MGNMLPNRQLIALAFFVTAVLPAAGLAPNQLGLESNDGVMSSNVKVGLGWSMENNAPYRVHLLHGTLEYFLIDRISIRGSAGLPLATAVDSMGFYPFMAGGLLHLLPRFWFDIYAGVEGGFVRIAAPSLAATWSIRAAPVVGMTLYFLGAFFIEAEAGYSLLYYSRDTTINLSAPEFRARTGIYL